MVWRWVSRFYYSFSQLIVQSCAKMITQQIWPMMKVVSWLIQCLVVVCKIDFSNLGHDSVRRSSSIAADTVVASMLTFIDTVLVYDRWYSTSRCIQIMRNFSILPNHHWCCIVKMIHIAEDEEEMKKARSTPAQRMLTTIDGAKWQCHSKLGIFAQQWQNNGSAMILFSTLVMMMLLESF